MDELFNVWVGAQIDPEDRLRLKVSAADRASIDELPPGLTPAVVTVIDLYTGCRFKLRRADCGGGCCCALEVVPDA
jgi:hypothetical protein